MAEGGYRIPLADRLMQSRNRDIYVGAAPVKCVRPPSTSPSPDLRMQILVQPRAGLLQAAGDDPYDRSDVWSKHLWGLLRGHDEFGGRAAQSGTAGARPSPYGDDPTYALFFLSSNSS